MVFSVSYGQNLRNLKLFTKKYNIPHVIQNLQTKTSYQAKYKTTSHKYTKHECSYIKNDRMTYYFADGTVAPCCFMIHKEDVFRKKVKLKNFLG